MYRYETHMHTLPVSRCARYNVRENLEFYKSLGYDGIFITNHFLDGNINIDKSLPYEEKVKFYFSDYHEALALSDEIGIKIFLGVEISYRGTDFLIYGLDEEWYLSHPEIMDMKKSEELPYLASHGALVVQAHPYRQDRHIDHIRLFPHCIEGVETINACRTELENRMADIFADSYGFVKTAGSDNHIASRLKHLAGMESETPLVNEADFIKRVRNSEMKLFTLDI
jgi:predicted metal-dependent phosphoesterase TrpH